MADTLRIYSNKKNVFEKELKMLKSWNTSARNKELITQFHNYLFSTGSGNLRVAKLSSQLRRICSLLDKDLDKINYEDIEKVIALYNRKTDLSDNTKADYRRCIKQFFRWFKEIDLRLDSDNPEDFKKVRRFYKYIEKEIKISYTPKKVDYSTILSDDDIERVLEGGCKSIKEKAFIKILHESGTRAGEFLNIKLKDIKINNTSALIFVDGKTGERSIPITQSLPYLVRWLDLHPFKNNSESYIWLGESTSRMYQPLMHKGGQKLINRCFNRAGESKKHNFHHFRHSRATLLAPKITESLLCKYMGWRIGSNQVRVYVHLCTKELEDAILQMNGIKKPEYKMAQQSQICPCGALNTGKARYCYKCGKPLNMAVVIQDQEVMKEQTDKTVQVLQEIMQNPKLLAKFKEFKTNCHS